MYLCIYTTIYSICAKTNPRAKQRAAAAAETGSFIMYTAHFYYVHSGK